MSKTHPGFKIKIIALMDNAAITFDGRYSTLKAQDVDDAVVVTTRHNGSLAGLKSTLDGQAVVTTREYVIIDEDDPRYGQLVPKEEVKFFQVKNGEETEVEKFEKTKVLEIVKMLSVEEWDSFLFESVIEMWPETEIKKGKNVRKIKPFSAYQFALDCIEKKQLPIAKFSHGNGFKEFWAIIKPIVLAEGTFGFRIGLTRKRIQLNHLTPIPQRQENETPEEETKTVSVLTDI